MKLATSLDGKIATRTGASQWITGVEARKAVHEIRAAHDAIVTGVGTVLADNPHMNVRLDGEAGRQPARLVLDSSLRTHPDAKIIKSSGGRSIILTATDAGQDEALSLRSAGAEVHSCSSGSDGSGIDIQNVIRFCEEQGFKSLMVEAGPRVVTSFLSSGVVKRIEWFRAPILIGGDGYAVVDGLNVSELAQSIRFRLGAVRKCGADLWETYEIIKD